MQPNPEDTTINIPITFDYKGGRGETKKNKVIATIVCVAICVILIIGTITNQNLEIWKRWGLSAIFFYIFIVFLRFYIFKEQYYSDVFEELKAVKNILPVTKLWSIFDIDYEYPYICYFRNGSKGIFVKMEKGTITGKGETARFDHYEAISEAYKMSHSLNMDLRHIDYMDNVGNDSRLQGLYDRLKDVTNPDLEQLLIDMYSNLQDEMSANYSSFDIYLFLTHDKLENFKYNVQSVASFMLGGNFITYRVLNRVDIRTVCMALFNLHDFSVTDACEAVLKDEKHKGLVPIRLMKSDGTIEKLNDTQEEKRIKLEEQRRKAEEAKLEAKNKKKHKKGKSDSNVVEKSDKDDDLNLW